MRREYWTMITHSTATNRFEATLDGQTAVAEYRLEPDTITFTHTWVPPEFRGRGIAEKLVLAGFEFARAEGRRIVPECSYVARLLERHPEFRTP